MIRALTLLRLKCRVWWLHEQAVHAEELLTDHENSYALLLIELRKVKSRVAMLEKPEVLLRQALRRN